MTTFPCGQPFCTVPGCPNLATKWDGGIDSYTTSVNEEGLLCRRKLPRQFRCDEHDPHGKWFDIEPLEETP